MNYKRENRYVKGRGKGRDGVKRSTGNGDSNLRESSCAGENNLVAGSHAGVVSVVVVLERDHEATKGD